MLIVLSARGSQAASLRQQLAGFHHLAVFADLERHCSAFPKAAFHNADGSVRDVTVWCSNDYLGMGQNPLVTDRMIEVVRKLDGQQGFRPLPRRWVVERTIGWLTTNRRLAKDYERLVETGEMLLYLAMSRILLRRLTRKER